LAIRVLMQTKIWDSRLLVVALVYRLFGRRFKPHYDISYPLAKKPNN